MIQVKHLAGHEWEVTVSARTTTTHRVQVAPADLQKYGHGQSAEDLLRASFHFLLDREPNTSILNSFPLAVISRYFPEYEREMKSRLAPRRE